MKRRITTEFSSPKQWEDEKAKYKKGEPVEMYARYSYPELQKREEEFAEMIGVPDTALFNSGMAAIHTTIEAEQLRPGDIVMCAKEVYGMTKEVVEALAAKGITIHYFDSADTEEFKKMSAQYRPRLVVLESIANSKNMEVANIDALAETCDKLNESYQNDYTGEAILSRFIEKKERYENVSNETKGMLQDVIEEFKRGNNPFVFRSAIRALEQETGRPRRETIQDLSKMVKHVLKQSREKVSLIIDNTLASPALFNPLSETAGHEVETVVVESGTKHFQAGKDKITSGIAYSDDEEKIKTIKNVRAMIGTYLQPVAEKEIPKDITEQMPEIMARHAKNAVALAQQLDNTGKIEVSHPNLPKHEQNELIETIAPDGAVSLFYIRVPDAQAFIKTIKAAGGDSVGIGSSFGHDKTWLSDFELEPGSVRIAVGSESEEDFKKTLQIFEQVLQAM
ncbi:MAG: PLP-dependent transferase [Candidatus Kerfeldbacteria bacterium]